MSILIKGAKKPRNCEQCFLSEYEGIVCSVTNESITRSIDEDIPSWCPLVEVPEPHGRLIDADELNHEYYKSPSYLNLCNTINAAPTVIEAEEEEHE